MDKALTFLLFLVILGALALALPVGIGVYQSWGSQQTNTVITGTFAVCGGAVALASIAFGLALGLRDRSERRRSQDDVAPTVTTWPAVNDLDHWRAQKMQADAQRAALALERDRRALLEAPDQADGWPVDAGAWRYIDATEEAGPGPSW